MAKKIKAQRTLQINAGQAKPGPELASLGINMPQFCSQFNDATKSRAGDVVPVKITAYDDKSFDFELKTTPVAVLLRKAAGVEKGASNVKTDTAGTVTAAQVKEIAEYKVPDVINATSLEAAIKMVEGTARSMGIKIADKADKE